MTKILGQEVSTIKNQLVAIVLNIYSWALSFIVRRKSNSSLRFMGKDGCISIAGPGGLDKLALIEIPGEGSVRATVGYNVPGFRAPYLQFNRAVNHLPRDTVLIRNAYFSINYADVCIRWGLYESALQYVGWPIVPGFDFAGVVEWAGADTEFVEGDEVFGFTMFGAYSNHILVPASQIRKKPTNLSLEISAALPAVAATALHALSLAGGYPGPLVTRNKAALIHSAAGGVGSMLIQMCKLQGFSPVVAVVGSKHKISFCKELGADHVIDKSSQDLWVVAKLISPNGYCAIFDANGISTLNDSYENLSRCGRLIVYGFHGNLPKVSDLLSPFLWVDMALKLFRMPRYDPMDMTLESKGVLGFNLSFFADEKELISKYLVQIIEWVSSEKVKVGSVTVFPAEDIGRAHELIQSGSSIGKIVCSFSSASTTGAGNK